MDYCLLWREPKLLLTVLCFGLSMSDVNGFWRLTSILGRIGIDQPFFACLSLWWFTKYDQPYSLLLHNTWFYLRVRGKGRRPSGTGIPGLGNDIRRDLSRREGCQIRDDRSKIRPVPYL